MRDDEKNLKKFYKKSILDSTYDYYIIAFKLEDLLFKVMKLKKTLKR